MLISCFTFRLAEVQYIPDISYEDGGYYESRRIGVGFGMRTDSKVYINFRTQNGGDKIIVIAESRFENKVSVGDGDKVLFKFDDGKELVLTYNKKVSEYDNGRFRLSAKSEVIDDFGVLTEVQMHTSDDNYNFDSTKTSSEKLIIRFNLVKGEALLRYGESL